MNLNGRQILIVVVLEMSNLPKALSENHPFEPPHLHDTFGSSRLLVSGRWVFQCDWYTPFT